MGSEGSQAMGYGGLRGAEWGAGSLRSFAGLRTTGVDAVKAK